MYLVLMALLALNVSNEILKSFHLFEVSFSQSRKSIQANITDRLMAFEQESKNQPVLIPYFKRATEAHQVTDEFVSYIDDVIRELEELNGGRKEADEEGRAESDDKTELVQADNMERHAHYFLVDKSTGTAGWRGKQLEDRINSTRKKLVDLLKSNGKEVELKEGLSLELEQTSALRAELAEADQNHYNSWAEKYMENSPLAAVISLLTKIQSDARSLEMQVIDELAQGKIDPVPIEELVPVVRAKSSAILLGEEYKAEVFLAARTAGSENNLYEMENGNTLSIENGVGQFSVRPTSPGSRQFKGVIRVKGRSGEEVYPFESEYQVFNGQAAISADAMNILYIGVDNPITIAVPGISPKDVLVSISNGTLTHANGNNYVAKVTSSGRSTISVSARLSNGTTRLMGRSEYRVRNLPKPEATWGSVNNTSLTVPKELLLTQRYILANMGEDFAFDGKGVNYSIEQFRFIFIPKRQGNTAVLDKRGGSIDKQLQDIVMGAKKGDQIIVAEIIARGPDGRKRLNTITFTIG